MKFLFIVFILTSVNGSLFKGHFEGYDIPPPQKSVSRAEVITNYFFQRIDHFDPSNTNVFSQRYYVNTEYYNTTKGDVVFLWIAGEGQASINWMTGGSWIETAKKYGALLFQLEHRFYGVSHPFTDLSSENLRYLSSRQALEDTATFISAMNQDYNLPNDVKWIVFGGSYAGSLAAWLKQKYPHLVQGAVCSSGPLFAKLEFPEYIEVVVNDMAAHSQGCVDAMRTAFNQLDSAIVNQDGDNITALFNLCYDIREINTDSDITTLFEAITNNIFVIAQYNKNSGRTFSVDDMCDILTNETYGDELHRLAEFNSLYYGSSCMDYRYQSTVDYMNNINITASGNMRQWIYQTCTEYGWYLTSDQGEENVFGNRFFVEESIKLCEDIYGTEYNASYLIGQIDKTNTHYGGYDIDVRNVVFVHGSFDPWHPMGLTETISPEAPVILINGTAHCSDLYAATENDLPQLTAAREEVSRLIGVWLGVETSGARNYLSLSGLNVLLVVLNGYLIIISK